MKHSEYLRQAKGLIDTPEKWVQGVSWEMGKLCALEAIGRMCPGEWRQLEHDRLYWDLATYLAWALSGKKESNDMRVVGFNDQSATTHSGIMALYDKAIALAESEEEPKRLWDDLVAAEKNAPREKELADSWPDKQLEEKK